MAVSEASVGYQEITPQTAVPEGYTGIYTVEDLKAIAMNPTGNYIQMADIDAYTDSIARDSIAISTDMANWQLVSSGFICGAIIKRITYGNGMFIATTSVGNTVLVSTDAINWEQRTIECFYEVDKIIWGNGIWVALGSTYSSSLAISTDGVTWDPVYPGYPGSVYDVAYGDGMFVSGGYYGRLATSTDGITWTARTPGFGSSDILGINYNNGTWIAVGKQSKTATSQDGVTWVLKQLAIDVVEKVAYGNGLWVMVGSNGAIQVSTDRSTWQYVNSGVTSDLQSVSYGNNLWVVVGSDGCLITSSDGVNWTKQVSGFEGSYENILYDVAYSNGRWVAVGYAGYVITSTDGIIWEGATMSGDFNKTLGCVVYGNGIWMALSGVTTGGVVIGITSTDGINWTIIGDTTVGFYSFWGLACKNGMWVGVGVLGKLYTSVDNGVSWVSRTSGFGTSTIYGVIYGDNRWVAVGDSGKMATSPDGITWSLSYALNGSGIKAIAYDEVSTAYVVAGYSSKYSTSREYYDPLYFNYTKYLHTNFRFVTSGNDTLAICSQTGNGYTISGGSISSYSIDLSVNGLVFLNGIFVAACTNGMLAKSADGLTWEKVQSAFGTDAVYGVAYGDNTWVTTSKVSEPVNWFTLDYLEGTYDGNGYKILNLQKPLFGTLAYSGQIKNVYAENVNILVIDNACGVCISNDGGKISNCKVTGRIECGIGGLANSGGVVGDNYTSEPGFDDVYYIGEISNCTFIGTIISHDGRGDAGGIACFNNGLVSKCSADANIISAHADKYIEAGGICSGNFEYDSSLGYYGMVVDCVSSGTIDGRVGGGIVSYSYGIIENCTSSCDLKLYAGGGGIVSDSYHVINNCVFTGTIFVSMLVINGSINSSIGGIVGFLSYYDETILHCSNCYSTADIVCEVNDYRNSADIGGAFGYAEGNVRRCFSTGSVTVIGADIGADEYACVGGFAGILSESNFSECFCTGDVVCDEEVSYRLSIGGFAGDAHGSAVLNCYNKNSISGGCASGAGFIPLADETTISNCYAVCSINVTASEEVSSFICPLYSTPAVISSYYDATISSLGDTFALPKTTEELKLKNTFTGWDFDNTWIISPTISYPELYVFTIVDVTEIHAIRTSTNSILVRWGASTDRLDNFTFSVYQALAADGTYELIASNIVGNTYQHNVALNPSSTVKWYFKVSADNLTTQESSLSSCISSLYFTPTDPVAEAILFQHEYFLKNILNRPPVKLLIKNRSGVRCPVCWDEELQQVTKSRCLTCYSTGYTGGYYPLDVYISFTEPGFSERFDITDVQDVQQGVTTAWAPNYPLIQSSDVIVDEFNRRFIVLQAQPTTKDGRVYLRQLLQLQLIPANNSIYKFPV
jgi:hypothetical protein